MHTIRMGKVRRDKMTHRTKVLIRSMSHRVKIAHLLIVKVKKRIWPVKRPLATVVKGENLQNDMLPRLRRKAKLAVFLLFVVYSKEIWYFSREEAILKIDLLGKGLTQEISEDSGFPWWAPGMTQYLSMTHFSKRDPVLQEWPVFPSMTQFFLSMTSAIL